MISQGTNRKSNENPGNVKAVIKDKNNLYLVGVSSYPSPVMTYSLLGGHTEKGETPFETLGREMYEESSLVLELNYDEIKEFYIKDPFHRVFYLIFDGISVEKKTNSNKPQWYVFFIYPDSFLPFIDSWKDKFLKNQMRMKSDVIETLKNVDQNLNWNLIMELFLKRKFQECKQEMAIRLTKSEIEQVMERLREIGYYLENKNLILASKEDLQISLYETDVLKYL